MSESSKGGRSKKDALLVAMRKGQAEKVARILATSRDGSDEVIDADMEADSARNCLLHKAARYGHLKVVQVLLDANADPNRTNKFGMTPLHHASVAGAAPVVSALIGCGARAGAADDAGRAPLHWAAGCGWPEVTEALLAGGARAEVADKEGWTPLHRCCQERPPEKKSKQEQEATPAESDPASSLADEDARRADIAAMLLAKGAKASRVEPKGLQTPLHLCAMNGYARTARVLLERGRADVDARNKIGQTAMMYACTERHLQTVKVLLEFGPDLGVGNALHWEWTALHWAVLQDDVEIVRALLEAGADDSLRDAVGRTPANLAEENYKKNVQKLFKSFKK